MIGGVGGPRIDIVICTYNNAGMLERALDHLAQQVGTVAGDWAVLVVDNNSTDGTRTVVSRHVAAGLVPGLRVIGEPRQGLTHARRRGIAETTAPWVAFVDDDCMLAEDWLAVALAFPEVHPDAAGFGGRVVLTHPDLLPEVVQEYGWAFAAQDHGDADARVGSLAGAGMIVHRESLAACGWTDGPLLEDRVGKRLVSGGDVEIALRLAATGRPLWYVPALRLRHVIPGERTALRYVARLVRSLGVSQAFAGALAWPGSPRSWLRGEVSACAVQALAAVRPSRAGGRRLALQRLVLDGSFVAGRLRGASSVGIRLARGRCAFFGVAAPR